MPDREPIAEQMLKSADATAMPWAEATRRLTEDRSSTFWLATARPDGRPHVVPVWAVWLDDALYFATFQDTEGAPTAGPPPYDVYVVTPTVAFGFGTDAENWNHPTRWRFAQA